MKKQPPYNPFTKVKESAPELSLQEVNKIIDTLPVLAATAGASSIFVKGFFKSKFLIMTSIPIIAISTAILLNINADKPSEPLVLDGLENKVELVQENINITEKEIVTDKADEQKSQTVQEPYSNEIASTELQGSQPELQIASKNPTINTLDSLEPIAIKTTIPEIDQLKQTVVKIDEKIDNIPDPLELEMIEPIQLIDFESGIPDLTSRQMRQLKRNLYKHLVKDGIVLSKNVLVEITLSGQDIKVNDRKLNPDQFLKYSRITSIAGTGTHRKIKMDPLYILVGDFTEQGFIGSGYGTFQEKFKAQEGADVFGKALDENENDGIFTKERETVEEQKRLQEEESLFQFAKSILKNNRVVEKSFSLFSVNLKNIEPEILHTELYALLIEDNILETLDDMAVIELGKDQLRINGQIIEESIADRYYDLCQDFRVKAGKNRQIWLSKKIIRAGDYFQNKFRGTSSYLGE